MATTPRARASTTPKRPMALLMAHSAGMGCADEWLEHSADSTTTAIPSAAWRARAYASFVNKNQHRTDFLQLLAEWERGFDQRLVEAEAYKRSSLAGSRTENIKRISDDANTFAALLSVIGVFPRAEQQSTLIICADIARGVSSDLDLLVGGAV